MTVRSCILSLPSMRRKKKSRKLAKIHVHHKYSANMLSIMHSQRNQKVLITRMKDKPEQNPNKGSSSACVSEMLKLALRGNSRCSAHLTAWPSVNRICFSGIFLSFRTFNRFWICHFGLHKNTHVNSLSQTPSYAAFENNVRVSPTQFWVVLWPSKASWWIFG